MAMDSLKTFSVGVTTGLRKRTCVVCLKKIPVGERHVVIRGTYGFAMKLCKRCLKQLSASC